MGGVEGDDEVEMIEYLEESLTRMTAMILLTHLDDIPLHMQRHTGGAGSHFCHLLKKVVQVITCYIDHHHHD